MGASAVHVVSETAERTIRSRLRHLLNASRIALLVWAVAAPSLASDLPSIVLDDGPSGLQLVSAPQELALSVGNVVFLPVEVQEYHRSIAMEARPLIHTFINDQTAAEPGDAVWVAAGTMTGPAATLKVQTLRMRPHTLGLRFTAQGEEVSLSMTISPVLDRWAPVFAAGFIPDCPQCYWGALPDPYENVWGPDCSPCETHQGDPPGTTRNAVCIKEHGIDQCRCWPTDKVLNTTKEARIRAEYAPRVQRYASQILRHQIGWTSLQPGPVTAETPDPYLFEGLSWLFGLLSPEERDYSPLLSDVMEGTGGWMSCPDDHPMIVNQDTGGSIGFFDESNDALVGQYHAYIRKLVTSFAPQLRFVETMNEPCYGFYLCPCRNDPNPSGACVRDWVRGPDHRVCDYRPEGIVEPHQSEEFARVYAGFLLAAADAASEELATANDEAILIAGALELTGAGLTATTRQMIEGGLLARGNVAVMIHQFPYPPAPDWIHHDPCAYGPGWSLPPGCETPPPFRDYVDLHGEPVFARSKWQEMDEAMDVGEILTDVKALGEELEQPDLLSRFHLFDTELHAGFGVKDATTNAGRNAIAGLRIAAINCSQGFAGLMFTGNNSDPKPFNAMVRNLAGVTPVAREDWGTPLIGADYSGLVYKLFTRGEEDIIAVWSNAPKPVSLSLTLSGEPVRFKQVTLTRIFGPECPAVDCSGLTTEERERVDVLSEVLESPPVTVSVKPLQELYFLSVISDRPGFGWLDGLVPGPAAPLPLRRSSGRAIPF